MRELLAVLPSKIIKMSPSFDVETLNVYTDDGLYFVDKHGNAILIYECPQDA